MTRMAMVLRPSFLATDCFTAAFLTALLRRFFGSVLRREPTGRNGSGLNIWY